MRLHIFLVVVTIKIIYYSFLLLLGLLLTSVCAVDEN